MIALDAVAAVVGGGWLFQHAGDAIDARRYPAPGSRVKVAGGGLLHIYSLGGKDEPAVVFEAGISGSSLSWAAVQPLVAQFARAVVYDRSGLGWSGRIRTARTVANMVDELAAGLDALKVRPPYLLVGHSFGGLLVQGFAHRYPDLSAGVVMIDPVTQTGWANADATQLARLRTGAKLARRGALLARFGVVRGALLLLLNGGAGAARSIARASAGKGGGTVERLASEVLKLPKGVQPIVASHWSRPRPFSAMAAYLECLPASAISALAMPVPRGLPLTILSAATATPEELAEREQWVAANGAGRHMQVAGSGHWLQLDRPELVAQMIRESL